MTHIAQVPVKCTNASGEVVIVQPGEPLPPLLSDADIDALRTMLAIAPAPAPTPEAAPEPAPEATPRRTAKPKAAQATPAVPAAPTPPEPEPAIDA